MPHRWKPNVTVAAVIEREGRFLLVEENTRDGIRYNTPAGHLDRGEGLIEACRRETLEEAAYDFKPTALVGIYLNRFRVSDAEEDTTYLRFTFCGELGQHFPDQKLDTGILRAVWMTADEMRTCQNLHRSPIVMRCIDDYLDGVRYPIETITADPSLFAPPVSQATAGR